MRFKYSLMGVVLSFLLYSTSYSEEELSQGLGFAAGYISGLGISYKVHTPGKLCLQFTGGVWKTKKKLSYDLGFLLQRTLHRTENIRFYILTGVGYFHRREKKWDEGLKKNRWEDHTDLNTGFGLGIEVIRYSRIGVGIDGEFTYFPDDDQILFLPEVALHYYFK